MTRKKNGTQNRQKVTKFRVFYFSEHFSEHKEYFMRINMNQPILDKTHVLGLIYFCSFYKLILNNNQRSHCTVVIKATLQNCKFELRLTMFPFENLPFFAMLKCV